MNENNSLKMQTIKGAVWKFLERSTVQIISFVISVILARLLLPEDYGIIALVSVFIALCDKLVISGFGTALIQKKDADNIDFSTVFFFSLTASLFLYIVLFFTAPFIAEFYSDYNKILLTSIIRVMGIQIITTAINSVQCAYVSRTMQFKKTFVATLIGTSFSAIAGIWMAYSGYGVWALVVQSCSNTLVTAIAIWIIIKWRPQFCFSIKRFKLLYSYGWKLLVISVVASLYNNLRNLIIGKIYTPADLAFYNKGQSFPQIIESNISGTIDSVLFPAISKKQDSKEEMLAILRRAIKTSTYVLMPLLAGLAAVASPLVEILLTDKWLECVPYMQIICFTFMFMPIEIDNLQAIKAMGRSDLALKLEIIKKVIGVVLLLASIPFGVKAIALSMLVGAIINAIVDAVPNRKLLGYKFSQQIMDVLPSILLSTLMFGGVYALSFIPMNMYLLLVIQIAVGVIFYAGVSAVLKIESFTYLLSIIKNVLVRKKNT